MVGCSLPVSIVVNTNFRKFLYAICPKCTAPCRKTINTSLLATLLELKQHAVLSLFVFTHLYIIVSKYMDGQMKARIFSSNGTLYLNADNKLKLSSSLIRFQAFTGSQTGHKTAEAQEAVMTMLIYGIKCIT